MLRDSMRRGFCTIVLHYLIDYFIGYLMFDVIITSFEILELLLGK